jgi:hypothetical protein
MGKKSSPPPPDYAALAKEQGTINEQTAEKQTTTNRPDQFTPWGSTQWFQDPNNPENWYQTQTLNEDDQRLLDNSRMLQGEQQSVAGDLINNVGNTLRTPISLEGLPQIEGFDLSKLGEYGDPNKIMQGISDYGSFDFSKLQDLGDPGFGAVQEVQNAMMGRLDPYRQQTRESEIQRLKNQGLTENSEAFQRAMGRLGQGDTDAQQQALLGAMGAYGDIFNRKLQARQQGMTEQQAGLEQSNYKRASDISNNAAIQSMLSALRGQQVNEQQARSNFTAQQRQQSLAEQQMLRDQPLNDYLRLVSGTTPTAPNMPSFMGGTAYTGADMYGAAKDSFAAQQAAAQAKQAASSGLTKGLFGLAGGVMGGPIGSMLASKVGGMIGGGG